MTQPTTTAAPATASTMPLADYLSNVHRLSDAAARRAMTDNDHGLAVAQANAAVDALEVLEDGGTAGDVLAMLAQRARANAGNLATGYRRLRGEVLARYSSVAAEQDAIDAMHAEGIDPDSEHGLALLDLALGARMDPEPTLAAKRVSAVAGGQVPTPAQATTPDEGLSMEPTLLVAWVAGGGLGEPRITLHGSRQGAVAGLAAMARELLQERIEYVPLALQGTPDLISVQEALIGNGFRGSVRECAVAL